MYAIIYKSDGFPICCQVQGIEPDPVVPWNTENAARAFITAKGAHQDFEPVREQTFAWLKAQRLGAFPFYAGVDGQGTPALEIAPDNCGFFALGLALLQGILSREQIPPSFFPRAVIYVAPTFRHSHFGGRQVVVHNRLDGMHELFSYNLYPGPSAKKGI